MLPLRARMRNQRSRELFTLPHASVTTPRVRGLYERAIEI